MKIQIVLRHLSIFFVLSSMTPNLMAQGPGDPLYEVYFASISEDQRIRIVEDLVKKPEDQGNFLNLILRDAVDKRLDQGSSRDVDTRRRMVRLLIRTLAKIKHLDSVPVIYQVFQESIDAPTRGEAAYALGFLKQTQFTLPLALDLDKINNSLSRTQEEEARAYHLVLALEAMGDPLAFVPLFLASQGWYSSGSRIRAKAKSAYLSLPQDLSESFILAIRQLPTIKHKYLALEALRDLKTNEEKTVEGALAGLDEALTLTPHHSNDITTLSQMRLVSLGMLQRQDHNSPQTVIFIQKVIDKAENLREVQLGIQALAANTSEESARFLNELLNRYNDRQKLNTNSSVDLGTVRFLFTAMARLKSNLTRPSLNDVQYSQYSTALKLEAQNILSTLKD